MSLPDSFQFQTGEGTGSSFREAPGGNVRQLIFQIETAASLANPQLPATYALGTSGQALTPRGTTDAGYVDETMTKLFDLADYSEQQNNDQEPSGSDGGSSSHDEDDSMGRPADENPIPAKEKRGPRGAYRQYRDKQWEDLLHSVTNQFGRLNMSEASRKAGIHPRTGRGVMQKYLENPDAGFPVNIKPRGGGVGRPCKLNDEHTEFIKAFFGDKSDAHVADLREAIRKTFDLEVS